MVDTSVKFDFIEKTPGSGRRTGSQLFFIDIDIGIGIEIESLILLCHSFQYRLDNGSDPDPGPDNCSLSGIDDRTIFSKVVYATVPVGSQWKPPLTEGCAKCTRWANRADDSRSYDMQEFIDFVGFPGSDVLYGR